MNDAKYRRVMKEHGRKVSCIHVIKSKKAYYQNLFSMIEGRALEEFSPTNTHTHIKKTKKEIL